MTYIPLCVAMKIKDFTTVARGGAGTAGGRKITKKIRSVKQNGLIYPVQGMCIAYSLYIKKRVIVGMLWPVSWYVSEFFINFAR